VKKFATRRCESGFAAQAAACSRPQEKGYVLLTMLLVIALMAIFAVAVITPIKFQIQRDQEQEMIHRGVQYTRAIRAYYKKFGRYPTKLEDLDSTNNLRYLRKHYKDPVTRQDFRLLHFGDPDVKLAGGLSIGGGTIPGANAVGSPNGMNGSGPGGSGFGNSAFGGSSGSGFGNSGVNSSGVFSQSSGLGGNSNSGFGANSNAQTGSGQPGTTPGSGSDSSQSSSETSSQPGGTGQGSSSFGGQQPFASGPIVGVASLSKKTTIREFNHKRKYNEWQFLYDPINDRGGLITTPNQPALQGFGTQPNLNGQSGSTNGNSSSPFSSGFGNNSSSGFGNNSNSGFGNNSNSGFGNNSSPGGSAPPVQTPANPQ
jgi:type II secretory pathway pseudopilin PulG